VDRVVVLQFENMDKVKGWRDAARNAQEKIGSKYATNARSQWKALRNTEGAIANDEDPGKALGNSSFHSNCGAGLTFESSGRHCYALLICDYPIKKPSCDNPRAAFGLFLPRGL
jgi:hypothetical protein